MITSELFSEAMGKLDPKYLDEMLGYQPKKKPKTVFVKYVALAAVLCLVIAAAVWANWDDSGLSVDENDNPLGAVYEDDTVYSVDLPMLTVSLGDSGMGFEGYWVYDISDLVSGNPWNEDMELSTLPVYQNVISYDDYHVPLSGVDYDKMSELLYEVAGRLGLDTEALEITDDAYSEERKQSVIKSYEGSGYDIPDSYFDATRYMCETDDYEIEVNTYLTVMVTFKNPVSVSDEIEDDPYALAEYFLEEYSELIDMENPTISIDGGDRSIYGEQSFSIAFYETTDDDTGNILSYNFKKISFICNSDGDLWMIDFFNVDLSDKIGDYPIITADEATEMLAEGKYLTSAPVEFPGVEYIGKVELIYRTGAYEENFIPYYRFYVEIDPGYGDSFYTLGMTTYAAYYVPAISEEYISDLTVWDGRFN
ncbi:MAG: hypothetical protein LUF29_08890 [Oscillospiraceae bacterium]|nr:hypothetical protein [Oscillospiraceae bacterium]